MISLIHPSRGRAQKSFDNTNRWIDAAGCDLQVIVSCDYSDKHLDEYIKIYKPLDDKMGDLFEVTVSNNDDVVSATNRACEASVGDILVYLSDDFSCFPGWGVAVEKEFDKYKGPTLIKVDDKLQRFDVAVLTIPIMNRACYDKLGYFFHPGYKSMFVDEHLYWRTKKLGFLQYAPHLKFEHCHVSVGKAPDDETYRRSAANWDQGKALFKQHQAAGFPV